MANVSEVTLCPKCGNETPKPKCKYCHHNIVPYENETFGTPDYISSQHREAEKLIKPDKNEDKERAALNAKLKDFITNISTDDREDAMVDALFMVRHALIIDMQGADLKKLIKIGIRIGTISKAIDQYIKDGGLSNGTINTAESEPSDEDNGEPR